jgi:hypothetical protein
VGMVEQHVVDVRDGAVCPVLRCRGGQVQHGGEV